MALLVPTALDLNGKYDLRVADMLPADDIPSDSSSNDQPYGKYTLVCTDQKAPRDVQEKRWEGKLSIGAKVTLNEETRKQLKIPPDAKIFRFAYPVDKDEKDEKVDKDEKRSVDGTSEDSNPSSAKDTTGDDEGETDRLWESFRSGGGFLYFGKDDDLMAATAFKETKPMGLDGPKELPAGLRETILTKASKCSLTHLEDVGVKRFCWVPPGFAQEQKSRPVSPALKKRPSIFSEPSDKEDVLSSAEAADTTSPNRRRSLSNRSLDKESDDWKHGAFCYFYEDAHKQFDCAFTVVDDSPERVCTLFDR